MINWEDTDEGKAWMSPEAEAERQAAYAAEQADYQRQLRAMSEATTPASQYIELDLEGDEPVVVEPVAEAPVEEKVITDEEAQATLDSMPPVEDKTTVEAEATTEPAVDVEQPQEATIPVTITENAVNS